jgi:hypothetical protein
LVIDTSKVPVERFLDSLSARLGGSWTAIEVPPLDQDPYKMYEIEARNVSVTLSPMPRDRCNPNASRHTTWDNSFRIDFVYLTADRAKRAAARQKLIQAASDVGERLERFQECP